MKKLTNYLMIFVLLLGGITMTNSCKESLNDVGNEVTEVPIKTPFQQLLDDPELINSIQVQLIESISPPIVESPKSTGEVEIRGKRGDCCLNCTSVIQFINGPNPPVGAGYQLDVVRTCSSDPNSLGDGVLVGSYNEFSNPYGSSSTFEITDEHFFWFLATVAGPIGGSQTVDISVTDESLPFASNVYPISVPDLLSVGLNNVPVLMLHCDNISYSKCWGIGIVTGGDQLERVCCE
ncbi:MAG: hypothetical protein AB8H03_18970 [Saprospiraceae bacterium]